MDAQLIAILLLAILLTVVAAAIALSAQIALQTRGLRGEIGKVSERVGHLEELDRATDEAAKNAEFGAQVAALNFRILTLDLSAAFSDDDANWIIREISAAAGDRKLGCRCGHIEREG